MGIAYFSRSCVCASQANMDELRMDDVFALKPELKAQLDSDEAALAQLAKVEHVKVFDEYVGPIGPGFILSGEVSRRLSWFKRTPPPQPLCLSVC